MFEPHTRLQALPPTSIVAIGRQMCALLDDTRDIRPTTRIYAASSAQRHATWHAKPKQRYQQASSSLLMTVTSKQRLLEGRLQAHMLYASLDLLSKCATEPKGGGHDDVPPLRSAAPIPHPVVNGWWWSAALISCPEGGAWRWLLQPTRIGVQLHPDEHRPLLDQFMPNTLCSRLASCYL